MKTRLILIFIVCLSGMQDLVAQCAMCKTTIVNNVSNGELALAEGLNFGILYLFVTPYLAIMVIGGVWYYKYKKHGNKKRNTSSVRV
ncbi:MAG: hypothetical protein OCD76_04070 [Reichenbachiella sp.]